MNEANKKEKNQQFQHEKLTGRRASITSMGEDKEETFDKNIKIKLLELGNEFSSSAESTSVMASCFILFANTRMLWKRLRAEIDFPSRVEAVERLRCDENCFFSL